MFFLKLYASKIVNRDRDRKKCDRENKTGKDSINIKILQNYMLFFICEVIASTSSHSYSKSRERRHWKDILS